MQLVLSKNRVIAHGENFLAMGGVVINTETGAKYENATVAECEGCPSDIDKVGYEYHGGIFTPCAPYGVGNNNGFFMEVCETCATPRSSGIPIKHGLKAENMHPDFRPSQVGGMDISLLWENASASSVFNAQTVSLSSNDYTFLLVEAYNSTHNNNDGTTLTFISQNGGFVCGTRYADGTYSSYIYKAIRHAKPNGKNVVFDKCYMSNLGGEISPEIDNNYCVPFKIYGVKL